MVLRPDQREQAGIDPEQVSFRRVPKIVCSSCTVELHSHHNRPFYLLNSKCTLDFSNLQSD